MRKGGIISPYGAKFSTHSKVFVHGRAGKFGRSESYKEGKEEDEEL